MAEHGVQHEMQRISVPPGWYPETGTSRLRWWDGVRWSVYKDEWDAQQAAPAIESTAIDTGRLEQLAELHRVGALTDAEFSAAKARVLGI